MGLYSIIPGFCGAPWAVWFCLDLILLAEPWTLDLNWTRDRDLRTHLLECMEAQMRARESLTSQYTSQHW